MKKFNKSNPTEEVKNTNYRMHKGKKGWLVSYSLLSFVLGGVYMNNVASTPVKAAEVEAQSDAKTPDKDAQKEVDEQSLSAAKQNAITTLDNKANSVKAKINSDQKLSADDKAAQIATVDSLVSAAKTKSSEATDLVGVKETLDNAVAAIEASYQSKTVTANSNSITKPLKAKAEKAPKVNKAQKPVAKKVTVSTFNGLSSFFKTADDANTNSVSSSAKNTSEKTTSLVASDSVANTESAKLAGVATREDEPATDTSEASVAGDKDEGRPAFNDLLGQASGKTETSVNVPVPTQVTNPDKSSSVDVATLAQLAAAWNNAAVTYINITSDITYDASVVLDARTAGSSVVINGNGHTVDLGNKFFRYASTATSPITYFTLINTNYKQGFTGTDGTNKALLYMGGATGGNHLAINVDNITLSASKTLGANYNAIRGFVARGSKITFSGTNRFTIANEIYQGASVYIANDSSVIMERTPGAITDDPGDDPDNPPVPVDPADPTSASTNGEFSFKSKAAKGSVGEGNLFVMGDRSSNRAATLEGKPANYPAITGYVNGIKVGDDVYWMQDGFQSFFAGNTSDAAAQYVFGQNFKLDIPKATRGAIRLRGTQSMVFNAGTEMDINQNIATTPIINLLGKSTLTFISPKQLHLAIGTETTAGATRQGIVSGAGTFRINNSSIRTWDGLNTSTSMPAGQYSGKFTNMTVTNKKVSVAATPGSVIDPKIMTTTTRELQTDAITPGKVKIQYIDQSGKQVGQDYELPFGSKDTPYEDAYIGKQIPLVSQDIVDHIPAGYMWALGKQIYAGAKTDKQSGGAGLADKGDADGQANLAYIPMDTGSYTYKVYVYGAKQNVTYKYVDVNHPEKALVPKNVEGTEADNGLATANYGNTIDWTNKYYTETNVPVGYHYKTDAANQPATTLVSETNPTVVLYVEGDEQEIVPTYLDENSAALTPANPVVIKGRTGDTITIPEGPEIPNQALATVTLNGVPVSVGSTFEMPSQKDLPAEQKYTLVYKYTDLSTLRGNAITAINNALARVKNILIANDQFLSEAKKKEQNAEADNRATAAIAAINNATTVSAINKIVDDAVNNKESATYIEGAYVEGSLKDFKQSYKDLLDQAVSSVKDDIAKDTTLNSTLRAKQSKAAEDAGENAKAAIDQKAVDTADKVIDAYNKGVKNIEAAHTSVNLADAKLKAKGSIDQTVKDTQTIIDSDSNLSDSRKTEQKANAAAAGEDAKNNIDLATTGDELEKAFNDGEKAVAAAHVILGLDEIKSDAKGEIDDAVAATKDKINQDSALTTTDKATQIANAEAAGAAAKDKITAATTGEEVAQALATGKADVENAYKSGDISDAKLKANGHIDDAVAATKAKINADKRLPAAKKAAQIADAENRGAAAKSKIKAATTGDEVAQALAAGETDVANAYVEGTVDDAKQTAKEEIDNAVTDCKNLISSDSDLDSGSKATQTLSLIHI